MDAFWSAAGMSEVVEENMYRAMDMLEKYGAADSEPQRFLQRVLDDVFAND